MKTDDHTLDTAYNDIGSYRAIRQEIKSLEHMLDDQGFLDEYGEIYHENVVDIDLTERDVEALIAIRQRDIDKLKAKMEEL